MVKSFNEFINEEVDAPFETNTFEKAIDTIIKGKRNVGLISTFHDPYCINKIKECGLNSILVKQTNHDVGMTIIFNDEGTKDAHELYDFMKTKGGYVEDKTPEEAYYIGKLLGYTDDSIKWYTNRRYNKIKV
jgi:hypothetical protein